MKNLIQLLFILLIATITISNVKSLSKSNSDVSLAELISVNIANAESGASNSCFWTGWSRDWCGPAPYIPKMYCEPSLLNTCQ